MKDNTWQYSVSAQLSSYQLNLTDLSELLSYLSVHSFAVNTRQVTGSTAADLPCVHTLEFAELEMCLSYFQLYFSIGWRRVRKGRYDGGKTM